MQEPVQQYSLLDLARSYEQLVQTVNALTDRVAYLERENEKLQRYVVVAGVVTMTTVQVLLPDAYLMW